MQMYFPGFRWTALLAGLAFSLPIHAQRVTAGQLCELADGSQPATAALQRLIDESEGLVEIPPGTFLLDAPLRIDLSAKGYRSIRGADGTTRLIVDHEGCALQVTGDHRGTANPDTVQEHTWEKERMPVISGLEILGRRDTSDGIQLIRTMKCIIRNVLIRRCRYGIHLVERNRNVIITDSHLYDNLDTGIFLDACDLHQINITGNHISYNQRAGIRQYNGDVHNVQISGNDIEYNSGIAESCGEIVLEAPEGIISEYSITGNTLQARPENAGANIWITGGGENGPLAARIITVSGNIIGDRDKGIVLRDASRVTMASNTIYGGQTVNLHFQHCCDITLTGNTIGTRSSMHDGVDTPHMDGILAEGCADCLITGNILSDHRFGSKDKGGALTLVNTERCRVSDCQILSPRFRGVHIIGGMGCVVSDNTISAPPSEAFLAAVEISGPGHAHLIQNNWICTALPEPVVMEGASGEARNNTLVQYEETGTVPNATTEKTQS